MTVARRARCRSVVPAASALLVLVLAGCSGTDEADVPPPGPTATPTATPTVPTQSPSTGTTDPTGPTDAEAAFRAFWAAHDAAVTTGDTTALERLSSPACGYCATIITSVEQAAEQGQVIQGGTVTLTAVEVVGGDPASAVRLRGTLDQAAGAVRDGTATLSSSPATAARRVDARLSRGTGGWRVDEVVLGPAG